LLKVEIFFKKGERDHRIGGVHHWGGNRACLTKEKTGKHERTVAGGEARERKEKKI